MEAIRSALAAGASLDSLAAPYGGLRDSGFLGQATSFVPLLGPEPRVVQKAFAMQPGQVLDTLEVAQGVAWLRLEEKRSGDPATFRAGSVAGRSQGPAAVHDPDGDRVVGRLRRGGRAARLRTSRAHRPASARSPRPSGAARRSARR